MREDYECMVLKIKNLFRYPQKGFSLIELVVVFSILAIISAVSLAAFGSYSNSQIFQSAVSDVAVFLNTARSRSLSQVKPMQCEAESLDGYQVNLSIADSSYTLYAICNGSVSSPAIESKKLPDNVRIAADSDTEIGFDVSSGITDGMQEIVIQGFGKSSTIIVNEIGLVSVN